MKGSAMKKKHIAFFVTEGVLLAAAAFYRFVLLVYITLERCCLFAAFIVLLYFLLGLLAAKKPKIAKGMKIVLTVLLLCGCALFAVSETAVVRAAHTDKDAAAPYCVVLGAAVNGETPTLSLVERMTAAEDYLKAHPKAKAVLSGGQGPGETISEAEAMRRWLVKKGVSENRLILEDKSHTTEQNIANSLVKIGADGGDPTGSVAIVTSEYHLCRAKLFAERAGAEPEGIAARTGWPVLRLNYFIREAFGMAYLWILK